MHLYVIGVFMCAYAKCTGGTTCGISWYGYMGKCYLRFNSELYWKGAMLTCLRFRNNNQLVAIDNARLNTFIHHNITDGSDVWLGLTTSNVSNVYDWMWSDGNSITYIDDWVGAATNSFCVIMRLSANEKIPYWHTQICTDKYSFVCERDMVNHRCGNMWFEYEAHCYFIASNIDGKIDNMAAARFCWDHEAYLVSINNQSEAEFLYRNIPTETGYWIGLSPLKWLDGTPVRWNNWDHLGPNKDASCVFMNHSTGKWSSASCVRTLRFICQYELLEDIVSTTPSDYSTPEISHSSTVLVHESTSLIFSNISKENTRISFNHNTNVYIAVIAVLVVIVIGFIIAVIILVTYFKRRLSAKEPNLEGSAVYYNEVSDRSNAKQEHVNENMPNENSDIGNGPAANDRSMYEQLSPESYRQSAKITTGDYASLK